MSRLEGIEVKEKREYIAAATIEITRGSHRAALIELAKKLRERADAIERDLDRAASVMAP